jgi:glutathione peroxidase
MTKMSLRLLKSYLLLVLTALMPVKAAPAAEPGQTAYDFAFTDISGEPLPMSRFAGRTVLLVNTASQCGFTPQYSGLQALHNRYKDRGFAVLGVPSNDFGGQEPGDEAEIKEFCETTFGISFPMTEKVHVTGTRAHPLYAWLAKALGPAAKPRWNFHKILIGPDGRPRGAWTSITGPNAQGLRRKIESVLAETGPATETPQPAQPPAG